MCLSSCSIQRYVMSTPVKTSWACRLLWELKVQSIHIFPLVLMKGHGRFRKLSPGTKDIFTLLIFPRQHALKSSGFWALEGFIHFQRVFQLKSLAAFMLHQHVQPQHSQTWLIELSDGWLPHREYVSVSQQVLAQILKSFAYHPNLVFCYHLNIISGWYSALCCCTCSSSTPTPCS